jgi:predicted enzyme related to lactoylglutathione lyase
MYLSVTLDCADPEALADFWEQALDYRKHEYYAPYLVLRHKVDDGRAPSLCLQRVSEPKASKNRMHFDLNVDDVEGTMARLISLGATRCSDEVLYRTYRWFVLADPEGNEFCVIGRTGR